MTITSIEDALQIYGENLNWENEGQARRALAALRYLQLNRPASGGHLGSNLSWHDISGQIASAEKALKRFKRTSWTRARMRRL